MRILYVVNLIVPRAAPLVNSTPGVMGGWVESLIEQLAKCPGLDLGVAMRAPVATVIKERIEGVTYYLVPQRRYDRLDVSTEDACAVLRDYNPDILHVEGSESRSALTFLRCWDGRNVLSLQGIINEIEPYEYGSLRLGRMISSLRPSQMLVALTLIANKHFRIAPRLPAEAESLGKAQYFLGRTRWDRAHARAYNKAAPYFHCPRILRAAFYGEKWSLERCSRHSIYIGAAASARKGGHTAIEAVSLLRDDYPDISLYIAGPKPWPQNPLDWKKHVGYVVYLRRLIADHELEEHVHFVGLLDGEGVAQRLRQAHAYTLCSSIENSPNSLGEAMILGTPCVSAFVGGAPDMATPDKEALFFRHGDAHILADQLRRVFESDELAVGLSRRAIKRAEETHDPESIRHTMLSVYESILEKKITISSSAS